MGLSVRGGERIMAKSDQGDLINQLQLSCTIVTLYSTWYCTVPHVIGMNCVQGDVLEKASATLPVMDYRVPGRLFYYSTKKIGVRSVIYFLSI